MKMSQIEFAIGGAQAVVLDVFIREQTANLKVGVKVRVVISIRTAEDVPEHQLPAEELFDGRMNGTTEWGFLERDASQSRRIRSGSGPFRIARISASCSSSFRKSWARSAYRGTAMPK